ncbi:helix-turn-helix domain-containing protein [Paraburkholderia acidisoli]|uniref:Helix-turn-helix domain-containing protein n=1 Tax=Paraburkholderia acidisoli TaxID=2571748 RepID=A0A7Z2JGQ0_9BURK|nr:helix-turn-helix domain-containing protein [Paraburkholderia acidisoli]QGZ62679.1 helix-turn-helix domain-containing protein [Paraburkholderia acidisoli]
MKKARLFDALKQGLDELAAEREGKLTLHTVTLEAPEPLDVTADEIRSVREAVNVSQAVMARRLRVNVRTWQNWEQGKAKPNAQAAVLIKLVEKHPQTLELLEAL